MEHNYTALMMDIRNSRAYPVEDRNDIQFYITKVIHNLNILFQDEIACAVDFSAGDEIQGLFNSPEASYMYLRLFNMFIFPVETKAGMGTGAWTIRTSEAGTTAQDGPAYHNARRAIDEAKNSFEYSTLIFSGNTMDPIVNSAINMYSVLAGRLNEYQNELMLFAELLFPISIRGIVKPGMTGLLSDLIFYRNEIPYYRRQQVKNSNSAHSYPFEEIDGFRDWERCIPIDAGYDSNGFFITAGKTRGLSTRISSILGKTRQSIDKSLKSACIYEMRNATITALRLLYDGERRNS